MICGLYIQSVTGRRSHFLGRFAGYDRASEVMIREEERLQRNLSDNKRVSQITAFYKGFLHF